jgi:uncharacterized protein
LLLANAADTALSSTDSGTALTHAVRNNDRKAFEMLQLHGANVTLNADQGSKLLITAIEEGHLEMVKLLLANGISLDNTSENQCSTAIIRAAARGKTDIVDFFISQVSSDGNTAPFSEAYDSTALVHAARRGDQKVVEFLLDHGATIHQTREIYATGLMTKLLDSHSQLIGRLRERAIDLGLRNEMRTRSPQLV